MQLDNNNHSVFLMYYHLVLALERIFWSGSCCLLTTDGAPVDDPRSISKARVRNTEQGIQIQNIPR